MRKLLFLALLLIGCVFAENSDSTKLSYGLPAYYELTEVDNWVFNYGLPGFEYSILFGSGVVTIDSISPLKGKAGYTLNYYCTNLIDSSSSVFAKINNYPLDSLIKWSDDTVQVVIPIGAPRGTYTNPWLGHVPIADTVGLDTASTPYKNYKMGSE